MAELPEPTWPVNGQEIVELPSSLCFKRDPSILTGVFLQFIRSRFYVADNIINEQLKGYLWTPDETTHIYIEPSYKWDPTLVQKRPAVFVKRDQVQALSDMGFGGGRHTSHFNENGNHTGVDFTNILSGGHAVLCVGQSAHEAEALGFEVFFNLLGYREALQKEANLGKLNVQGVSPVTKVDENKENWLTSVGLSWKYTYNWTLYQEAPILKKVAFGVSLDI